ncbi:AAA family ATPase [Thermosulfuriphilus sp.]
MKPLKLVISGLHSYRQKVVLDFTPAIEAQIFGIFGRTGGGKSTILDAITLALFGRIDRLGRSLKEAINPFSEAISVELTFEVSGEQFRISRTIPRQGRSRVLLMELLGGQFQETAEKDQEVSQRLGEILGMTFEDFTRMVVLPQGKFDQFLFLRPEERARMLGRILDLERLGEPLFERVKEECLRHSKALEIIRSRLEALAGATEVALERLKRREAAWAHGRKKLKAQKDSLNDRLQRLKELSRLLTEAQGFREQLEDLSKRIPEIEGLRRRLQLARELAPAEKSLRRWLEIDPEWRQTEEEKKALQEKLAKLKDQLRSLEAEFERFRKGYQQALEEISSVYERLKRAQDLKRRLQEKAKEAHRTQESLKMVQNSLGAIQKELKEALVTIEALEEKRNHLKGLLAHKGLKEAERKLLEDLRSGLLDRALTIEEKLKEKRKNGKELQEAIREEAKELAQTLRLTFNGIRDLDEKVRQRIEELQKQREQLNLDIKTAQLIGELSQGLRPGRPCPICGSREHPQPASPEEAEGVLWDLRRKLKELRTKEDQLKKALLRVDKLKQKEAQLSVLIEEGRSLKEELAKLKVALSERAGLPPLISTADLNRERNTLQRREQEERDLREELTKVLGQQNQHQQRMDGLRKKEAELSGRLKALDGRLEALEQELQGLKEEINELTQGEDPDLALKRLENQRQSLKRRHEAYEKEVQGLREEVQALEVKLARTTEKIEALVREKGILEEEIKALEVRYRRPAQELLKLILRAEEVEKIEAKIRSFEEEFSWVTERLRETEPRLGHLGQRLPPGEPLITERRLKMIEAALTRISRWEGEIRAERRRLLQEIEEKKALLLQEKKTLKEAELAQELKKLIQGKALVKFAARFYLAQIVSLANRLLEDLSSGRLFLAAPDEDLNLTIHDLASGITRSVKTLSGGERFLVSFSLALGLSGYIQAQKARPINFFFVDEGFGSLDSDLQQQVAKVLERMLEEGRIVGLITHLEAFREMVPAYFWVEKEADRGTKVRFVRNFG